MPSVASHEIGTGEAMTGDYRASSSVRPSSSDATGGLEAADTPGKRARAIRLGWGRSQSEVAYRLGWERSIYARWERGKHAPSLSTVLEVAAALGVPATELLEEPPPLRFYAVRSGRTRTGRPFARVLGALAVLGLLAGCAGYPSGARTVADVPGASRAVDVTARAWAEVYGAPCLEAPRVLIVDDPERWAELTCSAADAACQGARDGVTSRYWHDPPLVLIRAGSVPRGALGRAVAHEWLHALEMRCDPPAPRAWWVYFCHGADPAPGGEGCTRDRSGWRGPVWGPAGIWPKIEAELKK
jgi:transcriptional regulator with XRE-family HTH domain